MLLWPQIVHVDNWVSEISLDFRGSGGVNPSNELGKQGVHVRMSWEKVLLVSVSL